MLPISATTSATARLLPRLLLHVTHPYYSYPYSCPSATSFTRITRKRAEVVVITTAARSIASSATATAAFDTATAANSRSRSIKRSGAFISCYIRTTSRSSSSDSVTNASFDDVNPASSSYRFERDLFQKFKQDNVDRGGFLETKNSLLEKERSVMKQAVDDAVYGDYKYYSAVDAKGFVKIFREPLREEEEEEKEKKEISNSSRNRNKSSSSSELVIDMASMMRYSSPKGGLDLSAMKPCLSDANIVGLMTRTLEHPYTPKLWIKFLDSNICVEVDIDEESLADLRGHCLHDFEWRPSHPMSSMISPQNQNQHQHPTCHPDSKHGPGGELKGGEGGGEGGGGRGYGSLTMYLLYRDYKSDRTDLVCEYTLDTSSNRFGSKVKRILSKPPAPLSRKHLPSSSLSSSSSSSVTIYTKLDKASKDEVVLLHREPGEEFHLNLSTSKDKSSAFIHSQSKTCTEVFLIENIVSGDITGAGTGTGACAGTLSKAALLVPKETGVRTFVDRVDGYYYVTSTKLSKSNDLELFKLQASISKSQTSLINEIHGSNRIWPRTSRCSLGVTSDSSSSSNSSSSISYVLTDFDALRSGVVVYGLQDGKPYIDVIHHNDDNNSNGDSNNDSDSSIIDNGEPREEDQASYITSQICDIIGSDVFSIFPSINSDINSKFVHVDVSNPLLPQASLKIDLIGGKVELVSTIKARWIIGSSFSMNNFNGGAASSSGSSRGRWHKIKDMFNFKEASPLEEDMRSHCSINRCFVVSSIDSNVMIPLTVVLPRSSSSFPPSINSNAEGNFFPTLLVGYGAYGSCLSVAYLPEYHELLERGWAIAFAHTRGGGEKGASWHQDGKLDKKWNSIHDFADCARYLLATGLTKPSALVAKGCSAGGILVGAGAARFGRELFNAAVMRSPFLDVLGVMRDPSLPLTVHEYDEWGKVVVDESFGKEDPVVMDYIKSYSPIDLVSKHIEQLEMSRSSSSRSLSNNGSNFNTIRYPDIMITVGLQDSRVAPDASLLYAASMRRLHALSSTSPVHAPVPVVLVRAWPEGGHDGPDSLEQQAEMKAEEIAFLEHSLFARQVSG